MWCLIVSIPDICPFSYFFVIHLNGNSLKKMGFRLLLKPQTLFLLDKLVLTTNETMTIDKCQSIVLDCHQGGSGWGIMISE